MIAWYTSNINSFKIIYYVRRGFKCESNHISLFDETVLDESIFYGILRGCNKISQQSEINGCNYWHIDNGYVGGDSIKNFRKISKKGYYRISKNGTQASYIDHDYPSDRSGSLNIKLQDWKDNKNGTILILPPTETISKYYGVDIDKWIELVKIKIGDRPYKIRTKLDRHIPLESEWAKAKCLVTYNSNAALEAIFCGVPAIITSNHSIIKGWNNLSLDDIDAAHNISIDLDRNKLINFLSHHQFTLEEIANGVAYETIKKLDQSGLY